VPITKRSPVAQYTTNIIWQYTTTGIFAQYLQKIPGSAYGPAEWQESDVHNVAIACVSCGRSRITIVNPTQKRLDPDYGANPCYVRHPIYTLYRLHGAIYGYRCGSPTAVQAWRPCPLWETSLSHSIVLVYTRGFFFVFLYVCVLIVLLYFVLFAFSAFSLLLQRFSFSTLILLVGSFDL